MNTLTAREMHDELVFWRARHATGHQRDAVGQSSNALLTYAMQVSLGAPVDAEPRAWPGDIGDLARCERTYYDAPEHLQRLMRPMLARFRREVAKRLIEWADTLDAETTR